MDAYTVNVADIYSRLYDEIPNRFTFQSKIYSFIR